MGIMQKRMIDQLISRFIVKNFETTNPDCFIDILDILESWEEYHQENALNYIINSKLIIERFPEIFPDCKVGEYRLTGISKRQSKVRPVKHAPTPEEIEAMQWRQAMDAKFERFLASRSGDKTRPFKVQYFANDAQSVISGGAHYMVAAECSIGDAKKYLSSLEYLYYDESDDMWHFHRKV